MITPVSFDSLGQGNYSWLKARYHFSFARYYNPARLGFGALLVVNDDRVAPQSGFDTHPHDNMEIITYVRKGAISHRDSVGNHGVTRAGDVQVMSAGTGVAHSEHNETDEETSLYQIWIEPAVKNVAPRWEAKQFPKNSGQGALTALASGRAEDIAQGALMIHQDATIWGGRLDKGAQLTQGIKHQGYLLVSEGEVVLGDKTLRQGDAASITGESSITLHANENAEVLLIDVPA